MTMNTGDISRRLGFPINAETLIAAGVTVAGTDKRATLFSDDWPTVVTKIAGYVLTKKSAPPVAKPEPKPRKEKTEADPAPAPAVDTSWEDDDEL